MGCRTEESSGKGSGRTFPSNWLSLDQKMLSGIWERKVVNDLTQWYTMYMTMLIAREDVPTGTTVAQLFSDWI